MLTFIQLTILMISVVLHEIAHGYVAFKNGDPTAMQLGRLSLNPIVHIDLLGTVLLPGLCVVSGSPFFIGWAKPVPVNTRYFSNPIKQMMWVALAGPLTNISIAVVASVVLSLLIGLNVGSTVYITHGLLYYALLYFIQINLVLAVFNLIPIPPLDGSRVIMNYLPQKAQHYMQRMEPYGFAIVFGLAYFGVLDVLFRIVLPPLYRLFIPGV
ncbi:site-2 protease family protein [Candidatus Marinamargulisbacteria bacterium SCGC AAA071-K20]|nr:site-2 protease family protein [Candidatus Marinamargulisbacteria bacterium SCGC AAA071-K20]